MRHGVLLSVLALIPLSSLALTKQEAKVIYDADKQKILAGDVDFDWKQFRLASAQGGTEYFDWHPLRNQAMQMLNVGDAKGALKLADQIIAHDMAEPEGHLLAMMADRALSKPDDAAYQRQIVTSWLKSLSDSGSGQSADTAIFVVNVGEEYMYLGLVYGAGFPESQSLVNRNGHSYDLLRLKNREGKEQEIWFNVDTSMAAMAAAIGDSKK